MSASLRPKTWVFIAVATLLLVLAAAALCSFFWRSPTLASQPITAVQQQAAPFGDNGSKLTGLSAMTEKALSQSVPVQNAQCLSRYFTNIQPNAKTVTLHDLLLTKAHGNLPNSNVPTPTSITRTIELNGTKLLLVATANMQEPVAEGTKAAQLGSWTLQTYYLPNPERPELKSTQTLNSASQLNELFPNAVVVLEEVTYHGLGENSPIVHTRNGLIEEIGFAQANNTRCEVSDQDNGTNNSANQILPLICQCT